VVLSRKIELGTFAQPGAVGFVVADIAKVKAVFSVPDTVVTGLKLGALLPITLEGGLADPERRGPITAIAPSADPQVRVFQVEVTLPNPRGSLRPGMSGTVTLGDAAPLAPQPVVPLSAVVRAAPGSPAYAVFVVEDEGGKALARRREVVLGDVLGNRIVVREGLRSGERVIVSGATLAVDGQPVRVVP
jgi:multidrug efflux system membrane fusion protein